MSNESVKFQTLNNVQVSLDTRIYIIECLNINDYVYSLPEIVCDGIKFTFTRIDSSNKLCSINSPVSSNIINGNTINSSIKLPGFSTITLYTKNNDYYIENTTKTSSGGNGFFSKTFIDNSANPGINIGSGFQGDGDIAYMGYLGTNFTTPIQVITLSSVTNVIPLTFTLYNYLDGASTIFVDRSPDSTIISPFENTFGDIVETSIIIITEDEKKLLPTGNSILLLTYNESENLRKFFSCQIN